MSFHEAARITVQALTAAAVGCLLVWLLRRIRERSVAAARIITAGLLLRIGLGLALFWIAFLDLPALRGMRTPSGFWTFALDSVGYIGDASLSALDILHLDPDGLAPDYVEWLTGWMRLVGVSPASALYLNACLFTLLGFALTCAVPTTGRSRDDLPLLVLLGSVAFSPALVIHSSQALKDDLCVTLVVLIGLGVREITRPRAGSRFALDGTGPTWFLVLVAVYLLYGMRNWAAGLVMASGAGVLLLRVVWHPRVRRVLLRSALAALVLTASVSAAVATGAAPGPLETAALRTRDTGLALADRAFEAPDRLRSGFGASGGNTNLAGLAESGHPWVTRVRGLAIGLAAMFVPATLLQAAGVVQFATGRALMLITDIDTLFTDLSIGATLFLLWRRPASIRWYGAYVSFALLLAIGTTLLMAYVVTNFGTLFRLRLMVAAPYWMLGLALTRHVVPLVEPVWTRRATRLLTRSQAVQDEAVQDEAVQDEAVPVGRS